MDFTKFLSELSLISKNKTKEEVISIFIYVGANQTRRECSLRYFAFSNQIELIQFSQKTTNFVPIGFETQEEDDNEGKIDIIQKQSITLNTAGMKKSKKCINPKYDKMIKNRVN